MQPQIRTNTTINPGNDDYGRHDKGRITSQKGDLSIPRSFAILNYKCNCNWIHNGKCNSICDYNCTCNHIYQIYICNYIGNYICTPAGWLPSVYSSIPFINICLWLHLHDCICCCIWKTKKEHTLFCFIWFVRGYNFACIYNCQLHPPLYIYNGIRLFPLEMNTVEAFIWTLKLKTTDDPNYSKMQVF